MEQNLIILFGGDSEERLVSAASAQNLASILPLASLWFWHKDGFVFEMSHEELLNHQNPFKSELAPHKKASFVDISRAIQSLQQKHIFVLATHGGKGENGFIQSLLEKYGHAFTGSNSASSKLAFDKVATKAHLIGQNLKLAPEIIIDEDAGKNGLGTLKDFLRTHGEIVIKPICGGSSIGCHFIRNEAQLDSFVKSFMLAPQKLMAEKLLRGLELTVGVIETQAGMKALPPTEIAVTENHDFDYDGKYLGVGTKEITPARVSEEVAKEAQRAALTAHEALGLAGYSRTDLIFTENGMYFLETNTLPGLTKQSLVPQQLAAAGISMNDFLKEQINIAKAKSRAQICFNTMKRS